ncbi:MAG: hypothetical protein GY950_24720 [bacterium]|nr:hypothetical protein [bacterium]
MHDYRVGSHIPDPEILKRFKDEDGEIFLEVRGMADVLFRVTTGNQVYYKIAKTMMEGEKLILLDDFSDLDSVESGSGFDSGDLEFPLEMGPEMLMDETGAESAESHADMSAETLEQTRPDSLKLRPEDIKEMEEGQVAPLHLRALCKKNSYGGYSLRFNRFLYILDRDYRVDVKSPDSAFTYQLENVAAPVEPDDSRDTGLTPVPPELLARQEPLEPRVSEDADLLKGDVLPPHLRDQCEEDISSEGGHRLMLDDSLYLLDSEYRVTTRMKLSYDAPAAPAAEPEPVQLPVEEVVANVVKHFEIALQEYKISADFFRDSVLGPGNRDVLIRTYHGDLSQLNHDTREALKQGNLTVLKEEKGFTLFRAALVHELYIKSTLTGRGDNMKYFITHIAAVRPDGTLDELSDNGGLSMQKQRELVNYFGSLKKVYTDKSGIITRVYRQVQAHIFKEYEASGDAGEKVRFSALLIAGLYEHTNRLDRGDGITMIRVARNLLDYK